MRIVSALIFLALSIHASGQDTQSVKKPYYERGSYYAGITLQVITGYDLVVNNNHIREASGMTPAISLGYCYKPDAFITGQIGFTASIGLEQFGECPGCKGVDTLQRLSSFFINVMDNRAWKFLSVGYGIGIAQHQVVDVQEDHSTRQFEKIGKYINTGITIPFALYIRLAPKIIIGNQYQPMIVSFQRGFKYGHTVSFNLLFSFKDPHKDKRLRRRTDK